MGDESLRSAEDPGEIAAAQLPFTSERKEDAQPGRIGECASPLDYRRERRRIGEFVPQPLGDVEIDAEKVTGVVGCHDAILTIV